MNSQDTFSQLDLFSKEPPTFQAVEVRLQDIKLPLVGPEPSPQFVDSVRRLGVMQPIIVSRGGDSWSQGVWTVIAGRRRAKAAMLAELETIPALEVSSGLENPETITLAENAARRANAISEYEAILKLVEKGFEVGLIAKELGIKSAVVSQRLRLRNLIGELYNEARFGKIAPSVAEAAAKLPKDDQEALFAIFRKTGRLTLGEVREARLVRRKEEESSLLNLFLAPEGTTDEIAAAIAHIDAAEAILKKAGVLVDFQTVRAGLIT